MPNLQPPSTPPSPAKSSGSLLAAALFALAGFADSAYLTLDHYFALPLPCTILHGCEKVLTSSYAMVGPIPLAALGVVFYLFTLFFALYLATAPAFSRNMARAFFGVTLVGLLASIAFESIQGFLIHAFCLYCAGSALATVLLFVCGTVVLRSSAQERI